MAFSSSSPKGDSRDNGLKARLLRKGGYPDSGMMEEDYDLDIEEGSTLPIPMPMPRDAVSINVAANRDGDQKKPKASVFAKEEMDITSPEAILNYLFRKGAASSGARHLYEQTFANPNLFWLVVYAHVLLQEEFVEKRLAAQAQQIEDATERKETGKFDDGLPDTEAGVETKETKAKAGALTPEELQMIKDQSEYASLRFEAVPELTDNFLRALRHYYKTRKDRYYVATTEDAIDSQEFLKFYGGDEDADGTLPAHSAWFRFIAEHLYFPWREIRDEAKAAYKTAKTEEEKKAAKLEYQRVIKTDFKDAKNKYKKSLNTQYPIVAEAYQVVQHYQSSSVLSVRTGAYYHKHKIDEVNKNKGSCPSWMGHWAMWGFWRTTNFLCNLIFWTSLQEAAIRKQAVLAYNDVRSVAEANKQRRERVVTVGTVATGLTHDNKQPAEEYKKSMKKCNPAVGLMKLAPVGVWALCMTAASKLAFQAELPFEPQWGFERALPSLPGVLLASVLMVQPFWGAALSPLSNPYQDSYRKAMAAFVAALVLVVLLSKWQPAIADFGNSVRTQAEAQGAADYEVTRRMWSALFNQYGVVFAPLYEELNAWLVTLQFAIPLLWAGSGSRFDKYFGSRLANMAYWAFAFAAPAVFLGTFVYTVFPASGGEAAGIQALFWFFLLAPVCFAYYTSLSSSNENKSKDEKRSNKCVSYTVTGLLPAISLICAGFLFKFIHANMDPTNTDYLNVDTTNTNPIVEHFDGNKGTLVLVCKLFLAHEIAVFALLFFLKKVKAAPSLNEEQRNHLDFANACVTYKNLDIKEDITDGLKARKPAHLAKLMAAVIALPLLTGMLRVESANFYNLLWDASVNGLMSLEKAAPIAQQVIETAAGWFSIFGTWAVGNNYSEQALNNSGLDYQSVFALQLVVIVYLANLSRAHSLRAHLFTTESVREKLTQAGKAIRLWSERHAATKPAKREDDAIDPPAVGSGHEDDANDLPRRPSIADI